MASLTPSTLLEIIQPIPGMPSTPPPPKHLQRKSIHGVHEKKTELPCAAC